MLRDYKTGSFGSIDICPLLKLVPRVLASQTSNPLKWMKEIYLANLSSMTLHPEKNTSTSLTEVHIMYSCSQHNKMKRKLKNGH